MDKDGNSKAQEKLIGLQIEIAVLQKECAVLRRDHEKVDIRLTEAYEKLSLSVVSIQATLAQINRTLRYVGGFAMLVVGTANWQRIMELFIP